MPSSITQLMFHFHCCRDSAHASSAVLTEAFFPCSPCKLSSTLQQACPDVLRSDNAVPWVHRNCAGCPEVHVTQAQHQVGS
eukprot:1149897-Pelagomonas_calceolata.AAC.6